MSAERPLRGHCQCGRNRYIVQVPKEASEAAQVLFDSTQASCFSQSTPLAAFLRVPLTWYQSTTYAFFPDETPALIHRTYSHPSHQYAQRHFCGFCGTPLAYWSEQPRAEADYIKIALGSLVQEDLNDLEDLGLIPDPDELPSTPKSAAADNEADAQLASHSSAMTWFDDLMEGSAMSTLRRTQVATHTAGGRTKVEWEITEWTEDGDAETDVANSTALGKRKLNDRADSNSPSQQAH